MTVAASSLLPSTWRGRAILDAPTPLLIFFAAFLFAIAYLVAASVAVRKAPVFPVSPPSRSRAANWQTMGDTLTIDGSDGDRWQYVSLARGKAIVSPDTTDWELAVQRYRMITPPGGAIGDLGKTSFAAARVGKDVPFRATTFGTQPVNDAIDHWYRYNLLTHLLEPNGHVFAVRTPSGALYKLEVVSYYCPRLVAGCVTIHHAPLNR